MMGKKNKKLTAPEKSEDEDLVVDFYKLKICK
jgi:hypothetical protein